jgi:hypothetical protein
MPPYNKRCLQSWQAAIQAAAKRRCQPNGVPDSEYFSDTEFPPLRMRAAEKEVAAQGRDKDAISEEEANRSRRWIDSYISGLDER